MPVTTPGVTFSDITNHANKTAIEALASRAIVNGYEGGTFAPNATMTRAEFATIVVKGLGLNPKSVTAFSDVAANAWFAPYIGTAYSMGIVKGVSDTQFDPNATITRQEAALMVARAAKLCGMETSMDSQQILNVLAQFGDYVAVADWAKEGVAFCYSSNILDLDDLNVEPNRAIRRSEIAQMIYNMLGSAELL
jgi:hypothetical protein